jgi:hypothetical protein
MGMNVKNVSYTRCKNVTNRLEERASLLHDEEGARIENVV